MVHIVVVGDGILLRPAWEYTDRKHNLVVVVEEGPGLPWGMGRFASFEDGLRESEVGLRLDLVVDGLGVPGEGPVVVLVGKSTEVVASGRWVTILVVDEVNVEEVVVLDSYDLV